MSDRLHDAAAVTLERLQDWHQASADTLRLRCGELSTEEVRLIRAVLNAIVGRDSPAVLRAGESSSTDGGRAWVHDKSGEAAGFEPVAPCPDCGSPKGDCNARYLNNMSANKT